jgi:site-specific DNA-methyltransferase (adenine-specific)
MIKINKVYNENCLDTLKKINDNTIDLVITSPPYNMNLRIRNGQYCSRQIVKEFSSKYEGFDDNLPIDEFYEFHLNVLKELIRTSSVIFYNIQIVTGSKRAFFKIIGELSDYLKDIIVWDKGNSQPAMAHNVLNRRTELILVFDSKNAISRQFEKANFQRGTLEDIWNIKRGKKVVNSHSAVFPEELVKTIIENFSNVGDLVYDPFMGTGTTAVVAKKLNRNYLGSELTDKYIEVINQRLLILNNELF